MRLASIALAGLLLASLAAVAAPPAQAVGICSELKDSFCHDYLLCVGYRWGPGYFQCTGPGVRNPFDPCTCPPPQVWA